ncbi:hypothetical protein evm_001864 [Chilo suppressalis]|nr:hypothetical protein evm_001864 [Chilo suppressalis]
MDTLQVSHVHSKGSSRSQSPATELARDPAVVTDDVIRSRVQSPSSVHHVVSEPSSSSSSRHGERAHHVKSHSRDLGTSPLSANTTGNSSRDSVTQKNPYPLQAKLACVCDCRACARLI